MVQIDLRLILAESYSQVDEKYPFFFGIFDEFIWCLVYSFTEKERKDECS